MRLGGLCEVCVKKKYGDAEPLKILTKYKEKYLKFSAFRGEVRTVLAAANILGVKF